jgi:hypothetical protein
MARRAASRVRCAGLAPALDATQACYQPHACLMRHVCSSCRIKHVLHLCLIRHILQHGLCDSNAIAALESSAGAAQGTRAQPGVAGPCTGRRADASGTDRGQPDGDQRGAPDGGPVRTWRSAGPARPRAGTDRKPNGPAGQAWHEQAARHPQRLVKPWLNCTCG